MIPKGCENDMIRRLAEMPFLDRLELVSLCRRARSAVYGSMDRLAERGMVQAVPHASAHTSPTRRYCLTAAGLDRLAELEGVSPYQLLASRPVSARWRRTLLERLDTLAVIYRIAASFPRDEHSLRFQWHRAGPLDAGITLSGGRTLAVVRLGNAADRTAFVKRLWRLSLEARPDAVLLVAPDEVRLRQVSRMLDSLPLLAFLALEGDAARAGGESRIWRTPASPVALDLEEVLEHVPTGGELPEPAPSQRESFPADLGLDISDDESVPAHLLPVLLKRSEKRVLDLLHDWPWLTTAHLEQFLGVHPTRVNQVSARLRSLGLAASVKAEGLRCLALSERGLGLLARRDRSAVGAARQRWSSAPVDPDSPLDWRNVHGSRSRQLLRNLDHTQAVHWFLAALAHQARSRGCHLIQLDPPRRAARFFRRDDRLHSVRPEAFGVVRRDGKEIPFFLEWERRAVRPVTMAARIAPYLRYYTDRQPLDDHGAIPIVLVVFDDDIAAGHFLRVADQEMRRAGVRVPLWVSHRAALEEPGPLGAAWRRPGSFRSECPF
ncbi:MAG: replication-relaxation family protein [Chloroflexota bacterium]|nr:replication-relaxation family protein [Chloroflexota bacterium]